MRKNKDSDGLLDADKYTKKELRAKLLAKRRQLSAQTIDELSAKIVEFFIHWDIYKKAQNVMFYIPMPDEPQIAQIFEQAWADQKQVSVPHLSKTWGIMEAAIITDFNDLVPGKIPNLMVPDPKPIHLVNAESIDLILIPGVAFDVDGYRLGMGAGYYDRFLPRALKAKTIGVCWDANVFEHLPKESHDIAVEYLLTEMGIFNCNKDKM